MAQRRDALRGVTKEKVEILILPFEASVTGRSPPVTGALHICRTLSFFVLLEKHIGDILGEKMRGFIMTIKKQLLLTIILSTLVPMIVMPWIGYLYIKDTVQEQLLLQSRRQLEEITRDMEEILDDILKVSNVVSMDDEIVETVKKEETSVGEKSKMIQNLARVNASYLYRYNAGITLYGNDGEAYGTMNTEQQGKEPFRNEWVSDTIKNKGYFIWKTFSSNNPEEPVLGMSRLLYDKNGKRAGVLCIEIFSDRYLTKLLKQTSDLKDTERYLADEEGNLVISYFGDKEKPGFTKDMYREQMEKEENGEDISEITIGTQKFIFLQEEVERTKWKMIQIVPYNEVFSKLHYYRDFTYISNFLCLALLVFIDNYTANRIGKSLIRLRDAMKQVRKGNFITLENREKSQEVHQIYDDFNNMSTKLDVLFKENERITKEKQECRLMALQTQIQPHFLFNTLNGIKWLCIIESAPTAERMIGSLGHILEYSLGKSRECVTLEEEIICLKHYIELQKMRYGNIFDVTYIIEESLNNFQVPVLILQPLVENSIVHGVRELEGRGRINIKGERKEKEICISVEDNGEGMSQEKIEKILQGERIQGSIGVLNVKERMELYYQNSEFEIFSEKGRGTCIRMRIEGVGKKDEISDCG